MSPPFGETFWSFLKHFETSKETQIIPQFGDVEWILIKVRNFQWNRNSQFQLVVSVGILRVALSLHAEEVWNLLFILFFLIILFVRLYYSNQGSLNSCVALDSFGFQLQYPKRSPKIKMLSFRGHQSAPLPYQEENSPLQSFILWHEGNWLLFCFSHAPMTLCPAKPPDQKNNPCVWCERVPNTHAPGELLVNSFPEPGCCLDERD